MFFFWGGQGAERASLTSDVLAIHQLARGPGERCKLPGRGPGPASKVSLAFIYIDARRFSPGISTASGHSPAANILQHDFYSAEKFFRRFVGEAESVAT